MLKIALIVTVAAVGLAILFAASGYLMRRDHHARAHGLIQAPQAQVWTLISDIAGMPAWSKDVASVEQQPSENGGEVWKQLDRSGNALVFVTRRREEPRILVREVRDPGGAFGGTWTIQLEIEGTATRVNIAEDGWIAFAPFRPIQRYIIGYDTTMKAYLADLARAAQRTL
jgi:hypothetical protein